MKSLLITLTCALLTSPALAAPFGLEAGMTLEQITAAIGKDKVVSKDGDLIGLATVPSPHSAFESYLVVISPDLGLVKIAATTELMSVNSFGDPMKQKFRDIRDAVAKTYGPGTNFDLARSGSMGDDPGDWMMGLLKHERTLVSTWQFSQSREHITSILLKAQAIRTSLASVTLMYELEGYVDYVDSKRASESKVF